MDADQCSSGIDVKEVEEPTMERKTPKMQPGETRWRPPEKDGICLELLRIRTWVMALSMAQPKMPIGCAHRSDNGEFNGDFDGRAGK